MERDTTMSTMKLPASYAVVDEEEMVYLDGGASDAYNNFLNVGKVFNYIAASSPAQAPSSTTST